MSDRQPHPTRSTSAHVLDEASKVFAECWQVVVFHWKQRMESCCLLETLLESSRRRAHNQASRFDVWLDNRRKNFCELLGLGATLLAWVQQIC